MTVPMLADFALRLACGLAAVLLPTPWRLATPAFFRTLCQVILGLLALAALDAARGGAPAPALTAIVTAAVFAYLAAVAWGLGLPRLGWPLTALVVLTCAGVLGALSRSADPRLWALNGVGRLASSVLLGATLAAMLLGHHYLTAPTMSIEPLKRFVRVLAWSLGFRAVLAAVGLVVALGTTAGASAMVGSSGPVSPLFLAVRWGMGIVGPAVAAVLTWKTVQIRSTQSATGLLYIALALVLFGELTAMALSRDAGVVL